MFNDDCAVKANENRDACRATIKDTEQLIPNWSGKVKDTITHPDGRVEVREWSFNVIVTEIGRLVAALMKNKDGYSGMTYWAVGKGLDSWDDTTPPSPSASDTALVNEQGRKAIPPENISFLDASDQVTETVTNKLKVLLTFAENECNFSWREFGIYGGNATSSKDSGIMINHKTHALIVKTTGMTIQREIHFTFN